MIESNQYCPKCKKRPKDILIISPPAFEKHQWINSDWEFVDNVIDDNALEDVWLCFDCETELTHYNNQDKKQVVKNE